MSVPPEQSANKIVESRLEVYSKGAFNVASDDMKPGDVRTFRGATKACDEGMGQSQEWG